MIKFKDFGFKSYMMSFSIKLNMNQMDPFNDNTYLTYFPEIFLKIK